MNNDPSSQTLFGAAAAAATTAAGAAADVKAQSLKLKISTNQADGTSKVVPSNNSSSSSSHDKNHHNHHHSKVAKDGGGVHKSSKSGNEVQKPKVSSHSSDKHKGHGDSNKSNSSFDKSAKPKDSSNSKPKENSHSSKDGKHSSKPKEGEKHKESGSINKPKPVSSSHNSSSSNKTTDGKPSLNNSIKDGHAKPKPNSSSSSNDKTSKPKEQVKSSSGDKHNSSMSSTKHSNPENKHKHSSSSSSKDAKTPNSSDKKKSSNDIKGGGDSSKHKSSEKGKESSDKHKHRDKENQEKEKLGLNMKQDGGNKVVDKAKEQREKDKVKGKEEYKPQVKVKLEVMSDEDVPLAMRKASVVKKGPEVKVKQEKRDLDDESEDEPLASRLQKSRKVIKTEAKPMKKRRMESDDSEDEPIAKRMKKDQKNQQQKRNSQQSGSTVSPTKRKKEEEGQEVWKWWEEEKKNDGSKWHSLEHKGPVFAPPYEPLPKNVKFGYNGKTMQLSESAEEVASMYAKFLEHEYTSKEAFNKNFFKDWRKMMTAEEREVITDLRKCDFRQMNKYFMEKNEERKNMTKEQKQVIKKQNEEMMKEYGFCIIDGHKEKIGNFKTEPPGLFRGRGEHPKMGMLKKRIMPEDVIINCSKSSKIPVPPPGHRWKEVRHDNTVTWLACWQENIQNQTKYIMLNPSSKLKGEKDWQKYETARKLKTCVDRIREQYKADWKSKEMKVRQRAVALYFIDKLALRAGNEKEEGETADTVGCCSLRVEHITLDEEKDGDENVVSFDFLGKDSIRYVNSVSVEKRVFKNLRLFMDNKQPGDDLFDRLNTTILNKHLNELMDGLTAKVFRTYNASKTLQEQLDLLTNPDDPLPAKLLSYNRANRAVAILCNHQRAVPKTFGKSMENLQTKINDKKAQVKEAQKEVKDIKKSCKNGRSDKDRTLVQKKEKALERLKEQLIKLELQATDKVQEVECAGGEDLQSHSARQISLGNRDGWT